ncbi:outer membrane protein assembly factor BamE [Spiribacter vilamensis]|uniref:Outer membrane protein assembly factor BamE n=1 Tax=Spiribacter vilamensis TaxID=531306 RepID=A0A4Q8CZH1_9GAMM|nr:outer membrane protein assembly factor BamE [Spiribacter vilamensis]RZU98431.1 Beta-barrel assembly machine subunit BamE [Spiribacter vilamensis]TVO60694.1 outer membrane protein assembly factor BamE [Spiribacter vilamensis]
MIPVYTGKRIIAATIIATLVAGCTSTVDNLPFLYKPEIRQGTLIDEEAVDKLRPGMTERQVRYVLGPPTIEDPFTDNRWDYVYEVEPRSADVEAVSRRLTLRFDEGGLSGAQGDFVDADHPLSDPTG